MSSILYHCVCFLCGLLFDRCLIIIEHKRDTCYTLTCYNSTQACVEKEPYATENMTSPERRGQANTDQGPMANVVEEPIEGSTIDELKAR